MGNKLPLSSFDEKKSRLKELRESPESHLTQQVLAEKCGVTVKTYRSWEKDISIVSCRDLVVLADIFDVSIDYLIGRSDFTTPENEFIGKQTGLSDSSIDILEKEEQEYQKWVDRSVQSQEEKKELAKQFSAFEEMESLSDKDFYDAISSLSQEQRKIWAQFDAYMDLQELVDDHFSFTDHLIRNGYIKRIEEMIEIYSGNLQYHDGQSGYEFSVSAAMYRLQESLKKLTEELIHDEAIRITHDIGQGERAEINRIRLMREEIRRYANSEELIIEGEDTIIQDE